jgi:ATP-binding cassette subfamily B protein
MTSPHPKRLFEGVRPGRPENTMADRRFSTPALYRRLLVLARPYWLHLAGLLVLSLVAPAFKLLSPLPLKIAVDSVLGSHPLPGFLDPLLGGGAVSDAALLALAVFLMLAIALGAQLLGLVNSLLSTYAGEKLVRNFRAALFLRAQRLSLSYHDSRGTADSTYRIQYDAPCLRWILADGSIPLVTSSLTLVATISVIVTLDWQLALLALAVTPALFVLSHVYGRRLRRRSKELKKIESGALSVVQEVLSAVRIVKAFGQEEREEQRYMSHSDAGMRARIRVTLATGSLGLLVGLTVATGTAAVLYVGVRHVQGGVLTLGELLMVMAYLGQLYGPMETLSKKAADLQGSLVSAERALTLLDEAPEVEERPDARALDRATGAVAFEQVSFAYPGNPPVLHDLSLRVPPGTRVGIEGKTGAGKSTLMSLLIRFYDPTAGRVVLDGVDLRDYRLADLRAQFAFVLQEPVLFSTTVAENIAYARPGASQEEIVAAAKAANAHDFITGLPGGYETRVGERGMRLSGGERQRISLARAFLKDAPVLVLDEPTSSVDVKTEGMILEALRRLMQGRTTFMIAHRLSTLADCNVRVRIEAGRFTFAGPAPLAGPHKRSEESIDGATPPSAVSS